jgi:hypothetical protein
MDLPKHLKLLEFAVDFHSCCEALHAGRRNSLETHVLDLEIRVSFDLVYMLSF